MVILGKFYMQSQETTSLFNSYVVISKWNTSFLLFSTDAKIYHSADILNIHLYAEFIIHLSGNELHDSAKTSFGITGLI